MSNASLTSSYYASLPTAGAVPVANEKGEITMQKVKVHRYISGRKPKYASSSSDSDSGDEMMRNIDSNNWSTKARDTSGGFQLNTQLDNDDDDDEQLSDGITDISAVNDRRFKRIMTRNFDDDTDRRVRNRHVQQPQIISVGGGDDAIDAEERHRRIRNRRDAEGSDEDEDNEEENVERRHAMLRLKIEDNDEEIMEKAGESEEESEEQSEYEEYTDSEDDNGPRLKPVFVRKKERITIQERDELKMNEMRNDDDARRTADERRRQTLKIIEDEIRREDAEKEEAEEEEQLKRGIAGTATDDENDETAYELWKLRELKRIKRDKDEREAIVKEKLEIERLRNMTEEERQAELRANPRIVTNQQQKGKYNFLQKYYHRGAFYLDVEDQVFKRDFAQPTLEDHFDRKDLPKVMQVKNFGRSGRTKYTHLVDQDTTIFDSPWTAESTQSLKFHATKAGGMKQVFDRPSGKRK